MEGNVRTNNNESRELRLKIGLAEMLKGGVIMDVTSVEQAVIAENAGESAVMALGDRFAGWNTSGFDECRPMGRRVKPLERPSLFRWSARC